VKQRIVFLQQIILSNKYFISRPKNFLTIKSSRSETHSVLAQDDVI